MAIYMKYGSINGSTTTEGFADWIECSSFQWGAGRAIASARGSGTNREASEPSISEITISKLFDPASSAMLFQEAVMGEMTNDVTFKFTTTSKGVVETYLEVNLNEAGISGYSASSGGDKPSESISINFGKIEVVPYKMEEGLAAEKGTPVSYNLVTMKANA